MIDEDKASSRIEKIEAENRKIKLALGLCIVLLIVLASFVLVDRTRTRNTLEAKEFLLRDQSDQIVARLGSRSVGACFEITGKTKQASATICAGDESGSDLLLTTHHGETRAFLTAGGKVYESAGESVLPGLIIAQDGKGLFKVTVGPEGELGLARNARENAVVISVLQTNPAINLLDNSGKTFWSTPTGSMHEMEGRSR